MKPLTSLEIIIIFLVGIFCYFILGCEEKEAEVENPIEVINSYDYTYDYGTIEVVEIINCMYILCHSSRGTYIQHYEGCNNMQHKLTIDVSGKVDADKILPLLKERYHEAGHYRLK